MDKLLEPDVADRNVENNIRFSGGVTPQNVLFAIRTVLAPANFMSLEI